MRLNVIITAILFMSSTAICIGQNSAIDQNKKALIQKLIKVEKKRYSNAEGKIIMLKSTPCEIVKCETFFKNDRDKVELYSKTGPKMKSITKYLKLESVDEKALKITYTRVNGAKSTMVVLTL